MADQAVIDLLTELGLTKYIGVFTKNEITFDVLWDLREDDLTKLGMTALGPRRKLQQWLSRNNPRGAPETNSAHFPTSYDQGYGAKPSARSSQRQSAPPPPPATKSGYGTHQPPRGDGRFGAQPSRGYAGSKPQQQQYQPARPAYRPASLFEPDVAKLMQEQRNPVGAFDPETFREWANTIKIDTFGDTNGFDIKPVAEFGKCITSMQLLNNLLTLRHKHPTPIQQHTLAWFATNRDLMISARTGSGKTAAFLVPVIQYCLGLGPGRGPRPQRPIALIFEPTRELAQQTYTELLKMTFQMPITSVCLIGQVAWRPLATKLNAGVHIVVCTVGRALDFADRGFLILEDMQFLVIDEADRLLDTQNSIKTRMFLSRFNKNRRTMLFAATLPEPVVEMAARFLKDDHIYLRDQNLDGLNPNVKQMFIDVSDMPYMKSRCDRLLEILEDHVDAGAQALIFVNSKHQCHDVTEYLSQNYNCRCIHAEILPQCREQTVADFRAKQFRFLICTDLLSRGIDLPNLQFVIQFELPKTLLDYITRVGRTGRLNKKGTAISMFNRKRDAELEQMLIASLREHQQPIPSFFSNQEEFEKQNDERWDDD